MATSWWVIAPAGSPDGTITNPVTPAGIMVVSAPVGSVEYNALLNEQNVTVGGRSYSRFMGPFPSRNAALSAHPPTGTKAIGALIAAGSNAISPVEGGGIAGVVGGAAGDVIGKLNVGELILRVTEILLGIVLIGIGLEQISGAENVVSKIAKNGIPIPV